MREIVYNKLIRDKIPDIIKNEGKVPVTKMINNDKEFLQFLIEKLMEEVQEFKTNNNQEELADILEVTYTIMKIQKWSAKQIETIRKKKYMQRGGFAKRIFLISVNE